MPTADGQNLSDSDIDINDGTRTKCFCPICGTDISIAEALQCDHVLLQVLQCRLCKRIRSLRRRTPPLTMGSEETSFDMSCRGPVTNLAFSVGCRAVAAGCPWTCTRFYSHSGRHVCSDCLGNW